MRTTPGIPALVLLAVLLLGLPSTAVVLDDVAVDPAGDVVDTATNMTADLPGIDILNARVADLSGDLEVSITLSGAPVAEGEYTVNVLVDSTVLFTFTRSHLGEYSASDPLGAPVAVTGWFDPDRVVWEVSTALLSAGTGLAVLSAYTFVTNSTGAVLADSLEVTPPANDPPVVAITAPSEGANVTGIVTVSGSASDDAAVTAVLLRVDGGEWVAVTGTETWSHVLDTTGLADGAHTIEARAFDGELSSAVVSVTVNFALGGFEPPMVTMAWPDGHTVSGTIEVTGTAADDGGVERVEVRVDGGAWQVASGTHAWTFQLDTGSLTEGEHTVEAVAHDRGGELSSTVTRTFVVTVEPPVNQPPTIVITAPLDDDIVPRTRQNFTLRGTASDDVAVLAVQVRLDGGDWMDCSLGGGAWTLGVDLRPLVPWSSNLLEARAFDGELYSEVAGVHFDMETNNPPEIVVTGTSRTSDHLLVTGTASDDVDPIERIEAYLVGEGTGSVAFEPVDGDPTRVTWTYKQLFRGLSEDTEYELVFTAYDAHDPSDPADVTFKREDKDSGVDPKAPGPGPVAVLMAMASIALVLHHWRLPRRERRRPI